MEALYKSQGFSLHQKSHLFKPTNRLNVLLALGVSLPSRSTQPSTTGECLLNAYYVPLLPPTPQRPPPRLNLSLGRRILRIQGTQLSSLPQNASHKAIRAELCGCLCVSEGRNRSALVKLNIIETEKAECWRDEGAAEERHELASVLERE